MRRLIWPVLFLLLILVQGAASAFYTGWLSCDLAVLGLYAFAMLRGERHGALVGFGIGFVQDALTVGVFGYHMLTRIALGYCVGLMKEKVVKDNATFHVATIAVLSAGLRFAYWWLELIRSGGRWGIFFEYLSASIGYILGNMLLVVPVVLLCKRVYQWIREKDISY
ncbi:MAG: rod shape-determining protein MreD [Phascolarctobacterium sp.]|nr:rod shape-determining protein MreD [Phascolarctobacterium sp.]